MLGTLINKNVVIGIISLIVILILGYLIYNYFKKRSNTATDREEVKSVKDRLKDLNKNVLTRQKLSPAQVDGYSNKLSTAMDGYGTDLGAVYNVFVHTFNEADVLALIESYGVRELSSGRFSPEPNTNGSLNKAFTVKLKPNEITQINLILAKRKINYKF